MDITNGTAVIDIEVTVVASSSNPNGTNSAEVEYNLVQTLNGLLEIKKDLNGRSNVLFFKETAPQIGMLHLRLVNGKSSDAVDAAKWTFDAKETHRFTEKSTGNDDPDDNKGRFRNRLNSNSGLDFTCQFDIRKTKSWKHSFDLRRGGVSYQVDPEITNDNEL